MRGDPPDDRAIFPLSGSGTAADATSVRSLLRCVRCTGGKQRRGIQALEAVAEVFDP